MPDTLKLSEEQVRRFDTEYVDDLRFHPIEVCINRDFPSGKFNFLDLGAGNGLFADRVLRRYPEASGVVFDSSEAMIARNTRSERKGMLCGDAAKLGSYSIGQFDLIFCNWILHHLVGDSYERTRRNVKAILRLCSNHLRSKGRISVYENEYNGIVDNLPSRLIYWLTSSQQLATIVRRLGANTAGVGVCFLSHKEWCTVFSSVGLEISSYTPDEKRAVKPIYKVAFLIRNVRYGHFWLRVKQPDAVAFS